MMKQGEYVLATKYSDGHPQDQWCVGYYAEAYGDRHIVADGNGLPFRASGICADWAAGG
jgi:hypothetical protein